MFSIFVGDYASRSIRVTTSIRYRVTSETYVGVSLTIFRLIGGLRNAMFQHANGEATKRYDLRGVRGVFSIFRFSFGVQCRVGGHDMYFRYGGLNCLRTSQYARPIRVVSLRICSRGGFALVFSKVLGLPARRFVFLEYCTAFSYSLCEANVCVAIFRLRGAFQEYASSLVVSRVRVSTREEQVVFPGVVGGVRE